VLDSVGVTAAHTVLVSNLLISAFVAAAVTLPIEYVAKPGLEARKERILEGQRLTRGTVAKLQLAEHLFSKLFASLDQDSPMQSLEAPEETRARIIRTIDPVMEAVASGQLRISDMARQSLMAHVAVVEFWRDDFGGDFRGNAETAVEFCELAVQALRTPWWRRRSVARIRQTLNSQGFATGRTKLWPPWDTPSPS
jgi:hypothetical protein